MEYKLTDKVKTAAHSPMRIITMKSKGIPGFIKFTTGSPSSLTFPVEDLATSCSHVFSQKGRDALSYGPAEGCEEFRKQISERLRDKQGINMTGNEIIILNGSQQGLDLMARLFCNEGDVVLTEDPTYSGALSAIRNQGVRTQGVACNSDGISIGALEHALQTNPKIKYLYIIPNHQNPTGISISLEKRKEVYELACRYNILIYEDDPYGELSFDGTLIPSIKSLDTEHRVFYAGSYSKVLAPGLRVGFLCFSAQLMPKLTAIKFSMDSGNNVLLQLMISHYTLQFDLDEHIEKVCRIYSAKCKLMKNCLDKFMHPSCIRTDPKGGMFIWVKFPDGIDEKAVFDACFERGVGVVPSSAFSPGKNDQRCAFRLCFTTPLENEIIEGVHRLGEVSFSFCGSS